MTAVFVIMTVLTMSAQEKLDTIKDSIVINPEVVREVRLEKERTEFVQLIDENPNYFGTIEKSKFFPVVYMKYNTKYEQLATFGLYPEQDMLEAFIDVKLPYGYMGDLCSPGSYEYVRFFVDWNADGDYNDADEDVGFSQVNVHDIPNTQTLCLSVTKPLTYSAYLTIDPNKWYCETPRLVRVKAVLSWQDIPTPGNPDYIPVWGNALEKWVQIAPKPLLVAKEEIFMADEIVKNPYILQYESSDLLEKIALDPQELKLIYRNKDVSELRFGFSEISQKIKGTSEDLKELSITYDNYIIDSSNTRYEQLNSVGLNYDLDELAAQVTVKLPYGYSGDLCSKGSMEYVAFWIYIRDQIEGMCRWYYVGTAAVNVHDIGSIPADGLYYALRMPANLNDLKDTCSNPVVLKVRGILSWGTPPSPTNPDYTPVWGNRVERNIQLKPGTYSGGDRVPFISVVGGMAVESISGNLHSVIPSTIGSGYANGPSVYGGYNAKESPFGGTIAICGHISNPPNNPTEAKKLKYKVQYCKEGLGTWRTLENKFRIWISEWNGVLWTMYHKDQVAASGWYTYEEDIYMPTQKFVEGNVLGQWISATAIDGEGLYRIKIVVYDPSDGTYTESNIVKVMIDNTRPTADVTLNAGACSQFFAGNPIDGTFTAWDKHFWRYTLAITPYSNPPVISPASGTYPVLAAPGVINQSYSINTNATPSCGYVVTIHVWDRTIRNNHMYGNYSNAHVGFCLLE